MIIEKINENCVSLPSPTGGRQCVNRLHRDVVKLYTSRSWRFAITPDDIEVFNDYYTELKKIVTKMTHTHTMPRTENVHYTFTLMAARKLELFNINNEMSSIFQHGVDDTFLLRNFTFFRLESKVTRTGDEVIIDYKVVGDGGV
jgi:hypothetical protein